MDLRLLVQHMGDEFLIVFFFGDAYRYIMIGCLSAGQMNAEGISYNQIFCVIFGFTFKSGKILDPLIIIVFTYNQTQS